jgi:hypothetical protein
MKHNLKKLVMVAATLALGTTLLFSAAAFAQGPVWGNNEESSTGRGQGSGSGYVSAPLAEEEIEALTSALKDEYHAWAVYDQVIQDFGDVSPFVQIRQAESRHADALIRMFDRYELEVPENDWVGAVPSFESVDAACLGAVQAEIDNAGLYDKILATTDKRDLTNVFINLQSASLNQHLPAFESCGAEPVGDWVDEDDDGVCDNQGSMQGMGQMQNSQQPRQGRGGRWNR